MRFLEANKEFEVRYYLWAAAEFEREIGGSFPGFRSFKTGPAWETYQFMQLLAPGEQRALARALLNRFHPRAAQSLGEITSDQERSLLRRRGDFSQARKFPSLNDATLWVVPQSLEEEIETRKRAGEKIKLIGKRKLLKLMAEKFQSAFAGQCVETVRVLEGDPSLDFEMKCHGWIVGTHFWFGRGSALLSYSHSIASEDAVEHQGTGADIYMRRLAIGAGLSFASWLGLSSQAEWEYLTDETAGPACNAAIKLCKHFFDAAPKLLQGLEFSRLDKEIY